MQKLQLIYATWERPDANQLFDYQSQIKEFPKNIIIQDSGILYRDDRNYHLIFLSLSCKEKINVKSSYSPILKIYKKQYHYLIECVKSSKQILCKIATNQKSGIHKLKLFDNLKMGKVQIQVRQICFKKKNFKSHYQQMKFKIEDSTIVKITQITPNFYEQSDKSQSLIQDNPSCRYCHAKSINEQNPFIVSCLCNGHTRYVHEACLLEWMQKRGTLTQIKQKGIFYIQSKIFKCQLCHQFFDVVQIFKKMHNYQKNILKSDIGDLFEQIMTLHFKYQKQYLFFINLNKTREISIGRSLQNDIVLNELSVSRKHCFLQINSQKKEVTLKDNQSKFGTLIQIEKTQVQNNESYQIGRSKLRFQKLRKKSFFEKLGFCTFEEKLRHQKKKSQRELLNQN